MQTRIVIAIVCATVCVVGIAAVLIAWQSSGVEDSIRQELEAAFLAEDMPAVVAIVERGQSIPEDTMTYWRIGLAFEKLGQPDEAIGALTSAVLFSKDDQETRSVLLSLSRIHGQELQFHNALDALHRIPKQLQSDAAVLLAQANLLDRMGRRFEANQYHFKLVKAGKHTIEDLILLASRQDPVVDEVLEKILNGTAESNNAYRLSRALIHVRSGKLEMAQQLLQDELAQHPSELEAHALLGLVKIDLGQFDTLADWHQKLPAKANVHPDVWFVRGAWAESLQNEDVAIQCYCQVLRLDLHHQPAVFRLLALLDQQHIDDDLRRRLTDFQVDLRKYRQLCKQLFFKGPQPTSIEQAILMTDSLFRFHEAIGWCDIQSSVMAAGDIYGERRQRFADAIRKPLDSLNHPVWQLVEQLESDPQYPQVTAQQLSLFGVAAVDQQKTGTADAATASFDDRALDLGVTFKYDNGALQRSGLMIQQSMGGGVAVIDFDRDGWPDLLFPQGSRQGVSRSDVLCRNRRANRFDMVEELAGCVDSAYSHGAAVGDVNEDGFPDLMVANRGQNHFYENNGDGTFQLVSSEVKSDKWTLSASIADINGDGFSDLFEVNYLAGDRPFKAVCIDAKLQQPRTCPPEQFDGEVNDLYLNDGAGAFNKVTDQSGLSEITGKSLGVVTADFNGDGDLSIFVANDQVQNEFLDFISAESSHETSVMVSNTAVLKGIAANGTGELLACMGVAAGDVNHDGRLDLFVTNFYRQENTLYTNAIGGGFLDSTREAKLRGPSLTELGFGTQFIDANLDSELDIVVGNGHLDDFTDRGIPFEMQPQLFMNSGNMQFNVQPASSGGLWFEERHLARGIAKLDYNRDGREDFVVSVLRENAAVLANSTKDAGHFLNVNLIGDGCSRDAVGAIVKIEFGDAERWMQVTAGDGYASANQKQLTFGLGNQHVVETMTIHWPSGSVQSFKNVSVDQSYLVVEQLDRLLLNPK